MALIAALLLYFFDNLKGGFLGVSKKRRAELMKIKEEEAEATTSDDYDEWPVEDLKTEAKDRSISDRGGKSVLIARLRRDDSEGDKPF